MIEGLKVTVTGDALIELIKKQAAFHQERCDFYSKQSAMYESESSDVHYGSSNGDPKKAIDSKLEEHQGKLDYLNFAANHLKGKEEYLLSDSDLTKIGVLKGSLRFGF